MGVPFGSFGRKEGRKGAPLRLRPSVAKSAPFSGSLIPEKIRVETSNIILAPTEVRIGLSSLWFEFHATSLPNPRSCHTRPDGIRGSYEEKLG